MERLMLTNELKDFVENYFVKRKLVWPSFDDAMKFAITEIAEVYELDLSRRNWVRNNPEDKPKFTKEKLAEELGDVIMMLMIAGINENVDPLEALINKMCKKIGGHKNE
jgi:NTP pyrophosphatase (non-canonical NTP hydrolase)